MQTEIEEFIGKTFYQIINKGDELIFKTEDGFYRMYHDQDCCETVEIEDIDGDLNDLVGTPILKAYENTNEEYDGLFSDKPETLWTFYHIATIKGSVVIRWCGKDDDGYYSKRISIERI